MFGVGGSIVPVHIDPFCRLRDWELVELVAADLFADFTEVFAGRRKHVVYRVPPGSFFDRERGE